MALLQTVSDARQAGEEGNAYGQDTGTLSSGDGIESKWEGEMVLWVDAKLKWEPCYGLKMIAE